MAELPSVSNAVQSSETLRNSLGLNYETAALPRVLPAQAGSGRFTIARRHPDDERAPESLTNCIHEKYSIFEYTYGDSPVCSFSQGKCLKFQGNDYLNTAPGRFTVRIRPCRKLVLP